MATRILPYAVQVPSMGLHEFRNKTGLTLEGVAEILGMSHRQIGRIHTGKSRLRRVHRIALAAACSVIEQGAA